MFDQSVKVCSAKSLDVLFMYTKQIINAITRVMKSMALRGDILNNHRFVL